ISNQGTGDGKISKAKFWFKGEYTQPEYRVRYLGRNHSTYRDFDEVQIAEDLNYIGPEILHKDYMQTGDFATGIARRQADGTYTFRLEHKASYITFRPFSTQKAFTKLGGVYSDGAALERIEISADKALCGGFAIKGDTIDLSSRPTGGTYKKVTCSRGGYHSLLNIPSEVTPSGLYAIMVVAPGTYTDFTVKYCFGTNFNFRKGYITKTYPHVTFTAGKNKVISQDLQGVEYPGDTYCMWDAADPYWKGYEWNSSNPVQPIGGFATDHYPKSSTDSRWYNTVPPYAGIDGAAPAVTASHSCKDCPNINELLWYREYGLPYQDDEVFVLMNHLQSGRIWLKKLSVIAREQHKTVDELKKKAPDGIDYTRSTKIPGGDHFHGGEVQQYGKPSNIDDYFCLPLIGGYKPEGGNFTNSGRWFAGADSQAVGFYWSSTPAPGSLDKAYVLEISFFTSQKTFAIRTMNRQYGFSRMWPADR
ncbi:hypothetical protein, partial [Prevotella denticola]|uniref:hypothetical protein n=1 Tax=Prevotella denticola TaxID=28129 RepID=UPI00325FC867